MKATVKKQRHSTAKDSRRGRRSIVVKAIKNTRTGQKKVIMSDWQHLTKKDADIIVSLINNPPRQNEEVKKAYREAEILYQSIQQLD
ncbi:MAG: hypothetical protein IKW19_06455 [Akkermansia sp.]|nr:hypothetical protein [Akkermansia sp.]